MFSEIQVSDFAAFRAVARPVTEVRALVDHLLVIIKPERFEVVASFKLIIRDPTSVPTSLQACHAGMLTAMDNLEAWWTQGPKTMARFLRTLQRYGCQEQGEVGEAVRFVMFSFAGMALTSNRKDLRHIFANCMTDCLRSGDDAAARYACLCLERCNSRGLGRFQEKCVRALMAVPLGDYSPRLRALKILSSGKKAGTKGKKARVACGVNCCHVLCPGGL
ncbi:unnamed protein product [Symbiodinium microadriaticum]|nr:unnamed protein product [Symbiodinium sp. KB8]CAE7865496.1 unnamed protein product [Symbiodinium microadriaticum]